MGTIFISHSSEDDDVALELTERLKAAGHSSVFLDFHPEDGIPAGCDWEQELYRRLRVCRALIILCSEHSMASKWCFAEIAHARAMGKPVIPVRVGECEIDEVLRDRQMVDLARDAEDAYERLLRALVENGLDPKEALEWDASRPPYPGLLAFDEADAAVYFGRDDAIRDGLDALERLHRLGGERLLVVMGASGSGKSSLVRAGLVPRLRRDKERWIVVDPFRPLGNPVAQLANVLSCALPEGAGPQGAGSLRDRLRAVARAGESQACIQTMADLAGDLRSATGSTDARVLVVVDQAEELLSAEQGAVDALRLIRASCEAGAYVVVFTLRSDFLGDLQSNDHVREIPYEPLLLGPIQKSGIRQVVTGPATVSGLHVETGLVDLLVEDAGDPEALPLLAFALRELWERGGDAGLTVESYRREVGGLAGAIARAAEETLSACDVSSEGLAALRRTFIRLVRINDEGEFVRKPLSWSDVTEETSERLELFVTARLLVSRDSDGERVVEVAHEALFRSWGRLAGWLDEARETLRTASRVESAATRWHAEGRHPDFTLPSGRPLEEARPLLTSAEYDLSDDVREFIQVSLASHDERTRLRRAADEQGRRRARQLLAALLLLLLTGGTAAYGFWQKEQAEAAESLAETERQAAEEARHETETLRLAFAARSMAMESPGGRPEALVLAIEAATRDLMHGKTPPPEVIAALDVAAERLGKSLPLEGHTEEVRSAGFSVDGARVLTVSRSEVRVWDAERGSSICVIDGLDGVRSAAFSPDGARVVIAGGEDTLGIWDVANGTLSEALRGHRGPVTTASFSTDGTRVVSASHDMTARVWDSSTGALLSTLSGHAAVVQDAAFAQDGSRVATASSDRTVRLWDARNGAFIETMEESGSPVSSVEFSPRGDRVIGTAGRQTYVWDVTRGSLLHTLDQGLERTYTDVSASYSSDGLHILTSSSQSTRIWSSLTGELLRSVSGASSAAWFPDGSGIVTTPLQHAMVYDARSGNSAARLDGHTDLVYTAAFSPDGTQLVTASRDKTARLWRVAPAWPSVTLGGHTDRVQSASFSADGRQIVTASSDKTARIWDSETGRSVRTLTGHTEAVYGPEFSPDGRQVVTTSSDGSVRLWDAGNGDVVYIFRGEGETDLGRGFFSPDGALIAAPSGDVVQLWHARDGEPGATLRGHADWVSSTAFSPDCVHIVTGSSDHTARIWDARTGRSLVTLAGHDRGVMAVAFSPDGTRVITGSVDQTARVWDVKSGALIHTLAGHDLAVQGVRFSPDGATLATSAGAQHIWNADTGRRLYSIEVPLDLKQTEGFLGFSPDATRFSAAFRRILYTLVGAREYVARVHSVASGATLFSFAHESSIFNAEFSPDGDRLVTASGESALVWSVTLEDRIAFAWSLLPDRHRERMSGDAREWLSALSPSMPVELRSWSNRTPLHIAASTGNARCIRRLLASASRPDAVNMPDKWGNRALHWASSRAHVDAARLLLEHGADPLARNDARKSPLDSAMGDDMVELLEQWIAKQDGR